jgi:hypothetical protein
MTIVAKRPLMLAMGVSLVAFAGCTGGSCGNILTILAKIGPEKNIGSLTACEWQTLFSELPTVAQTFAVDLQGYTIPQLNDEEAQAIVDFLAANGITTVDGLFAAVESGAVTIEDVPPVLLQLFAASMPAVSSGA